MRYRAKLCLAFFLLTIIPIAGLGSFFHISFSQNIEEHVFDKLVSIRDSKKSELTQHLNSLTSNAKLFSTSSHVRYSISRYFGFSYAFDFIDKDPKIAAEKLAKAKLTDKNFYDLSPDEHQQHDGYAGVHFRFDGEFQDFSASPDYANILLITPRSQVVYSTQKAEYFAYNLNDHKLKNSPVSQVFSKLLSTIEKGTPLKQAVAFYDFSWDKNTQQEVAYIAYPIIQHSRFSGVIVFAIPTTSLTNITERKDGLGTTGEAFLVGQDLLPRSRLAYTRSDAQRYSLKSLTQSQQTLSTKATRRALEGNTGFLKAPNYSGLASLTAYDSIDFLDARWSILVAMSASEALEKSVYFTNLITAIGIFLVLLIGIIIYYLSASMTKPLHSLMQATERVSKGNLDLPIIGSSRRDELGRLARSFVLMQQSIKRQITEIREVNIELKDKVETIEIQNKELQTADKLKDDFLANTSHELRTPLHGIIGIVESLSAGAAGDLTAPQQTQLKMVASSANRLSLLVDDLLDFHKIRHKQLRVNPASINCHSAINYIVDLSEHLIVNKPISIVQKIPDDLPNIIADPVRFEQVLFNLVGNSIKYTKQGEIEISASVIDAQVCFKVKDTGIGVASKDLDNIFKPFEQADGGITRKQGGSGLGLSISKQLVELMQGTMAVESIVDQGSTFSFSLPFDDQLNSVVSNPQLEESLATEVSTDQPHFESLDNTAAVSVSPLEEQTQQVATGDTILVVDDEEINLQILHNHLSLDGHKVLLAKNAQETFDLLEKEQPSLIILDVMLPDVSGFEISRKIRERFDLYVLPILMLTARSQTSDLVEGFNSGANDYVVKPFLKDELISRVTTLLQARQSVARLNENLLLKQEVARRLETEEALRHSQRGMIRMLDSIEDAIITFNSFDHVAYYNQAAKLKLGFEETAMIGQSIEQLISRSIISKIRQDLKVRDRQQMDLVINTATEQTIKVQAFVAQVGGFRSADIAIILHQISTANADQLPAITQALTSSQTMIETEVFKALSINSTPDSEQSDEQEASSLDNNKQQTYRRLLVDSMNDSIELWTQATGLGKIDFAEQSGIWRVYMDRSSLQTRTLDKYFLEETLPAKPRWRDVLRTGNYIIKYINSLLDEQQKERLIENPHYTRLQENLLTLKFHVK